MLDIKRREKYSNMGKTVNKSNIAIDINFDINTLNLMCVYIISKNTSIRRSNLISMRNLFSIINPELYEIDTEKNIRYNFIQKGLIARLEENLKDPYLIIKSINGGILDTNVVDPENLQHELSNDELRWIDKTISESLKYSFLYNHIDEMQDIVTRFKSADYINKSSIAKDWEDYIVRSMNKIRSVKVEGKSEATFSLSRNFEDNIRDIHADLTSPTSMIYTGMQGFNELTGGGLYSGRTYMLFGLPSGGKSLALLQLAYQIKKYNKNIKTKDPTKIPCVVLLTQENTVKETVDRLFNMSVMGNDIRDYNPEEIIRLLRQEGELYLSNDSPVDILIKFKPSKSIDTSYLYTLVEDLEDEGYECICLIHDYVKHIRSAYKQADLRLELGQVVMEYKVFSSLKDIPVISASQLNRDGARTIDAAAQSNKADLTRLLGRSNIGESMLMIENLDWASIVNIEKDNNGDSFLVFKRIKMRYKSTYRDYICQPFVSKDSIRIIEDLYLPVPAFKESTKTGASESNLYTGNANKKIITNAPRKGLSDIISDKRAKSTDVNIFDKMESKISAHHINDIFEPENKYTCPFEIVEVENRDIA